MASTINYQPPIVNMPPSIGVPPIYGGPVASHVNEADVVVISGGNLSTAAVNAANGIVGIAQHDSNANFGQTDTDVQGVFGLTQYGAGLMTAAPSWLEVATVGPPIIVEMNLLATTGWVTGGTTQANIGTTGGLNKDATTGYFFFDQTQTNAILTIVGKAIGPFKGTNGDLGARVYVAFSAASLAVAQGH